MNEREIGNRWLKAYKKEHPNVFVQRLPDSPVMRKPFDAFILQDGIFTAIEFKMEGNGLLAHQEDELLTVKKCGGKARVIVFSKDGEIVEDRYL